MEAAASYLNIKTAETQNQLQFSCLRKKKIEPPGILLISQLNFELTSLKNVKAKKKPVIIINPNINHAFTVIAAKGQFDRPRTGWIPARRVKFKNP